VFRRYLNGFGLLVQIVMLENENLENILGLKDIVWAGCGCNVRGRLNSPDGKLIKLGSICPKSTGRKRQGYGSQK